MLNPFTNYNQDSECTTGEPTVFDEEANRKAIAMIIEADFEHLARVRDAMKRQCDHHFRRLKMNPTLAADGIFHQDDQSFEALVGIHDIQCRKWKYWFHQVGIERGKAN